MGAAKELQNELYDASLRFPRPATFKGTVQKCMAAGATFLTLLGAYSGLNSKQGTEIVPAAYAQGQQQGQQPVHIYSRTDNYGANWYNPAIFRHGFNPALLQNFPHPIYANRGFAGYYSNNVFIPLASVHLVPQNYIYGSVAHSSVAHSSYGTYGGRNVFVSGGISWTPQPKHEKKKGMDYGAMVQRVDEVLNDLDEQAIRHFGRPIVEVDKYDSDTRKTNNRVILNTEKTNMIVLDLHNKKTQKFEGIRPPITLDEGYRKEKEKHYRSRGIEYSALVAELLTEEDLETVLSHITAKISTHYSFGRQDERRFRLRDGPTGAGKDFERVPVSPPAQKRR
ncbi:MAG: hypothetical protein HY514_02255 [Candidatus Aenigmarchaeota archaeon]|nr:hypothetical protein [Candidatus Aenigmarchaeota archaeon]